jgi:hypothetical protein
MRVFLVALVAAAGIAVAAVPERADAQYMTRTNVRGDKITVPVPQNRAECLKVRRMLGYKGAGRCDQLFPKR